MYHIRQWLSANIIKDSKKRAGLKGWQYNLDADYLIDLWQQQNGKCVVSGIDLQTESWSREEKNPYRASLDRIDNSKGYIKGNVRFTTHWVNNAKSTWPDEIFESFTKAISQNRS